MIEDFKKYEKFDFPKTEFTGYDTLKNNVEIVALFNEQCEQVKSLTGHGYAIFDKTPLYAMGGGQASDHGTITFKHKEIELIDLRKDIVYGYYIHEIDTNDIELEIGDDVDITVDADFRTNSSINHSALHITWKSILNAVGHHVDELGSKLDDKKAQLQYVVDEAITPTLVNTVIDKINCIIIPSDIKAHIFEVTEQVAIEKNYFYEFTKIPEGEMVRMVEFPGIVIEPCSGTHISSTSEMKRVYFLNYDKNNKRIIVDITTNEEFANEWFAEKIDSVVNDMVRINEKMIVNGFKGDLSQIINEAKKIAEIKNYISIKAIKELSDQLIAEANIFNKGLEKETQIRFTNLEIKPKQINNKYLVFETDNELYTNKIILPRASRDADINTDYVVLYVNDDGVNANAIMLKHKTVSVDLKDIWTKVQAKTEFKGGGTDSMIQMTSPNNKDIWTLLDLLK